MAKDNAAKLIDGIQSQGVFFMPQGAITTELHLAAFFGLSRRTTMDDIFFPEGEEGVRHKTAGGRKILTTDQLHEFVEAGAQSRKRPRKKGGNHGCDDATR